MPKRLSRVINLCGLILFVFLGQILQAAGLVPTDITDSWPFIAGFISVGILWLAGGIVWLLYAIRRASKNNLRAVEK